MTDGREVVELEGELDDVEHATLLNGRLKAEAIELDWSRVTGMSETFAQELVSGLALDAVPDALGASSMAEPVSARLLGAFNVPARAPAKKSKKKKVAKPPAESTPQVWQGEAEDAAVPPSERPVKDTEPPLVPRFLEAPPPAELRARLEDAVMRELLGPANGPDEEIDEPRVRERYLVGALAPSRVQMKPEELDTLETQTGTDSDDGAGNDGAVAAPTMFPSSIGLTFCIGANVSVLRVRARWGQYKRVKSEVLETEYGRPKTVWKRTQRDHTVEMDILHQGALGPYDLAAESLGPTDLQLRGLARRAGDVVVVSIFLVNKQEEPLELRDQAWVFQPELDVTATDGSPVFKARALGDGLAETEAELRNLAMLYRERVEFAVGHNVSVHSEVDPGDPRRALRVMTRVIPAHEVRQQTPPNTVDEPLLETLCVDMKELAQCPASELVAKLSALTKAYGVWLDKQRARLDPPHERLLAFREDGKHALDRCSIALSRIARGIQLLEQRPEVARAFQFANESMWQQRVHTLYSEAKRQGKKVTLDDVDLPKNRSWRAFQLAFVLLNLESIADLGHPDRIDPRDAIADLLWFPTGGGKTEAYLGLAAFTMGLRRQQGPLAGRSGEYGIAVLMRYTLRLLTLQQFQRATALICACEMIRRRAEQAGEPVWGREPFRIGLWVGSASTPNWTKDAAEVLKQVHKVDQRQASRVSGYGSPVQLKHCPWCGTTIEPGKHMRHEPFNTSSSRILAYCGDDLGRCPFSRAQSQDEGLPVVVVDEEIYRRLPTLLIATVDKFAQMPWNGMVQMLFGHVDQHCARHGFTSSELADSDHPRRDRLPGIKLKDHPQLRPPDLIIQDELHLISGPLGTLTGLYETAVDKLCSWEFEGKTVRPKVIASTATARRAEQQIHALFMRRVQVFPPQGLDVEDSFFARERAVTEMAGRRYLGICAPGIRLKAAIIRVYVAFLAASQSLYEDYGAHADPWMTLVGYFNSLRELAGTRRLVDDDIQNRLRSMDRRGLAKRRNIWVRELTSRLDSTAIPELLDHMELTFEPSPPREDGTRRRKPLDVLLATNMVSVGVDVKRLGLMVVAGQPKNTAEYIQATSRVGRSHPGLVCTIYNWARPRDLSHYEAFEHYHATFYSHVEAPSVTPFSPRALDRGLSALLVSLVRLGGAKFNANEGAALLQRDDPRVQDAIETIVRRAGQVEEDKGVEARVRQGLERRIDEWLARAQPKAGHGRLGYKSRKDDVTVALLEPAGGENWSTFTCLNSLRDVEASVDLIFSDGGLDDDDERKPFAGGVK